MAQTYPTELQDTFSRGSFRRVPGNNLIFSETDYGPSKVRRRTTLRKDTISGNILIRDNTEYSVFFDWFTNTLQDGVLSFLFDDPVTGNPIEVRFKQERFSISDVGYQAYSVSMVLEVVNG